MNEMVLLAILNILDLCPQCEEKIELEIRVVGMLLRQRRASRSWR